MVWYANRYIYLLTALALVCSFRILSAISVTVSSKCSFSRDFFILTFSNLSINFFSFSLSFTFSNSTFQIINHKLIWNFQNQFDDKAVVLMLLCQIKNMIIEVMMSLSQFYDIQMQILYFTFLTYSSILCSPRVFRLLMQTGIIFFGVDTTTFLDLVGVRKVTFLLVFCDIPSSTQSNDIKTHNENQKKAAVVLVGSKQCK